VLWQFVQETAALWSIPRYAAVFRSGLVAQLNALRSAWLDGPQIWVSVGVLMDPRRKGMRRIGRRLWTELASAANPSVKNHAFRDGHNRCYTATMDTMHELQIKMHQVAGVEVVEMAGAIDALAFVDLSSTLTRMIEEVTPCIVLECSRVTYIGSAQLKQLLDLAHRAQARGGDVKCVGIAPTIQHVANLIAMGDLIDFFDDMPQALRAFRGLPASIVR